MNQPTILTLDRLERELPLIDWRKPLQLAAQNGASGYACRVCIAVVGLRVQEIATLPQTVEKFAEHFRMAHDAEPHV